MKQFFKQNLRGYHIKTKVCIVGSGPVGMVLSNMLNKFEVPNVIIEKYPSF